jgi:hypothetical protein
LHFSPALKTQGKITENDDAPLVPSLPTPTAALQQPIRHSPWNSPLNVYAILSLLEDDEL